MHNAIIQCRANISRVKEIGGLYEALSTLTTSIVDTSDLLRTQVVMIVSALDHYVHEITRIGMLEISDGKRTPTDAFLKFQVSANVLQSSIFTGGATSALFENEIREKHSYLSFQQPDKIADAIRLFFPDPLWPTVGAILSTSANDVKTRLKLIVERRNKIAHEADMDPSYPGLRWPISKVDITNTVFFVENICEAIHSTVT